MEMYAHSEEVKRDPDSECSFFFPYIGKFKIKYVRDTEKKYKIKMEVEPSKILEAEFSDIMNNERPKSIDTMMGLINSKISNLLEIDK